MKYKEVSEPKLAADECLIAVKHSGICNSDIYRACANGAYFYPLIMGHEFAGIVEEAGADVVNFKPGDKVAVFPLIPCKKCAYCKSGYYAQCLDYDYYGSRRDGAFAQYIAVKAWNLFPLADEVKLEQAALLEPLSVVFHALKKVPFENDDSVVIFGAGIIGLVMAKYLSSTIDKKNIFIIDRNQSKLNIAQKYGVKVINTSLDPDWLNVLRSETKGGANHAIEACGAVQTFAQSLEIVRSHGHVLWVGNITGDLTLPKKAVSSVLRREIKLYGCWNSSFNHHHDDDWHTALDFITRTDAAELISHNISLEEGESIFPRLYASKTGGSFPAKEPFLKVMFNIL